MPKIALILMGCVVGYMFTGWALFMIFDRVRTPADQRKNLRVKIWMIVIFLLIGVGDSYKATKDLIKYVQGRKNPAASVK